MLTTKVVSNKKPPLLSDSESGGSTSHLMEKQKANIIPNQIECNGMKYMIKQNEFFQDDIDEISIEISWRYHDKEEMEYQEREIKREVIK